MSCFDSFGDRCSFAGVSFVEFPGVRFFTLFSLRDALAGVCWNYKRITFVKACSMFSPLLFCRFM